jgi:hypothetical protein
MVVWAWPSVPGTSLRKGASAPAVIGSWSLNASRKGFSQVCSTSHAARLATAAGFSGSMGTRLGSWRAASL